MPKFDPDKFADMLALLSEHTTEAFRETSAEMIFLSLKVTCFLLKRDRFRAETLGLITETTVVSAQYLKEICAVIDRYEDTPELIEDLVFQYCTQRDDSQRNAAREAAAKLRDV
jgi:hypothetical protein